jgi:ketosteroid isomerase-like protein
VSEESAAPLEVSALPFIARARAIAETLAKGWSKARVDVMMSCFAEGAVLIETPFAGRVEGAEAIRAWAADIPYAQSEPRFTVGEVFVAGDLWFSTEFRLVFRRRKSGQWVDARGAMFAETDGAKITELRMYWHRTNGGRDTSRP